MGVFRTRVQAIKHTLSVPVSLRLSSEEVRGTEREPPTPKGLRRGCGAGQFGSRIRQCVGGLVHARLDPQGKARHDAESHPAAVHKAEVRLGVEFFRPPVRSSEADHSVGLKPAAQG